MSRFDDLRRQACRRDDIHYSACENKQADSGSRAIEAEGWR